MLSAAASTRAWFTTADGRRLSYLTWGDEGPPVLLLHGGMACALDWWQVAEAIAGDWTVVAPDQRGCGESEWDPEARYGVGPLLEDTLELVERLGLERPVVIGHSLGAVAACVLAAEQPELVRALVLEDGGPRDGEPRPRVFDRPIPESFASREAAAAYLAETGLGGGGRAQWVLETRFRESDDGRLVWRADMAGGSRWAAAGGEPRITTLWDDVARLRCPTLVVRGGASPLFPPDVPARMAALNPLVSSVEVPGAGHGVHYEQPEAFVAAVDAFLASL